MSDEFIVRDALRVCRAENDRLRAELDAAQPVLTVAEALDAARALITEAAEEAESHVGSQAHQHTGYGLRCALAILTRVWQGEQEHDG